MILLPDFLIEVIPMLSAMEKQLNESQRDALVTGYMRFVAPNLQGVGSNPLTIEDLYEFLLLDPLIADEVTTSRVASVIASVQMYMTRIVNGSEPGFAAVDSPVAKSWRDDENQYSIWAAGAEVQNYPENYISPITRLEKSHYFEDLETALNQARLDPDHVQDAALSYLNQFEAVSNLKILSGYIQGRDFARASYYFIGRTTTKPYQYYWRQLDLDKNREDSPGKPVTPNCWSDWQAISLPLASDAVLEHTVRPVFYNDRLYVAWVERNATSLKDVKDNKNEDVLDMHEYVINFGYKRFDDSWTAPNNIPLMTRVTTDEGDVLRSSLEIRDADAGSEFRAVNLLATSDFSVDPGQGGDGNPYGRLMLAVFVNKSDGNDGINNPDTYGYIYCDSAFNVHDLGGMAKEALFKSYRDVVGDKNSLQFSVYNKAYVVKGVENKDHKDENNTGWWKRIFDLESSDHGSKSCVYVIDGSTVRVEMGIKEEFSNIYEFSKEETENIEHGAWSDLFVPIGFCRANGDSGVTIRSLGDGAYVFDDAAILYDVTRYGSTKIKDGDYQAWIGLEYDKLTKLNLSFSVKDGGIAPIGSDKFESRMNVSGLVMQIPKEAYYASDFSGFFVCLMDSSVTDVDDIDDDSIMGVMVIDNIKKIYDYNKFNQVVSIASPSGVETVGKGDPTDSMDESATCLVEHALSEEDFTEEKRFITATLGVEWSGYNIFSGDESEGSSVSKAFQVNLELDDTNAPENAPHIVSRYDSKRGLVQYLDFSDVKKLPANTRMNTTFVRTLIEKANIGLDSLLDYTLQADDSLEADLENDGRSEPMDFSGANGLYFWELFFHVPFLIASRFASERQFDQSQKWLRYIFDPAAGQKDNGAPLYWNVRPLVDAVGHLSHLLGDPLDPDTQAYAHPDVYRKAVFVAYVSNLIAQGDQWYRQLTRDGLAQARVFYNLAAELLGTRPDVSLSNTWAPHALDELAKAGSEKLRGFEHEQAKADDEQFIAMAGQHVGYLRLVDNDNFIEPLNSLMLAHWDALDARLYNLRHNLTIDGKPMSLALYEAPADPVALLVQRAQSGTQVSGVSGARLTVPPYRFIAILPRAYNAVATLSRFGETLLSLLERSDRASQEELQQQQFLDMSSYAITLQQQAIDGLAADRQSLEASRVVAQNRYDSYYALYQENISSTEQSIMDTRASAQGILIGAQSMLIATGALKLIPNVFGLADGGSRYEGATEATANVLMTVSQAMEIGADRLATSENYRRRREEWQIQYEQAQAEVDALDKQLDALTIREQAAQTELMRVQVQQAQTQATLNFLKTRFTQATLYQWLSGQLAALYYQVYDAVVSMCLSAQACWQYEMGDFATTFVRTGAWNDHYRGLQVGETLQLNLHQMEAAYLARNERRLEITRTVSLKDLLKKEEFDSKRKSGSFDFDLNEKLFDEDYPGHYMRQIKTVSISLPTLVGPYQDVKATLTQTKSSTLLNASVNGVKYLNNPNSDKGDANIVTNLRASQQIAISSGLNDAGQFELNFGDERYLPFEGTGAVSSWILSFPRHDKSATQKAMLDALTDVIVHVRYTAVDGGESFAKEVEGLLKAKR
ncbi:MULTISPECIES: neuraminidase-like domain-containing protein [Burkholderia]|uniref:Tc toxin subunit A-related protein n=1 Tax=Burkholderia TaxID=32008 RepID=UPI000A79265B|nr:MULTISPECIES: neuraminidase-like domain-containing protein [Burkholderia]